MKKQILLVDGYNMIGAWPELEKLKNQDLLEDARDSLLNQLSNYQKYQDIEIIIVFDAQFVSGLTKTYTKYQLTVIFTSEGETADSYIEKITSEKMSPIAQVTVATSDLAEQWTVFSRGALRISANELYKELKRAEKNMRIDAENFKYQNIRRNSPWDTHQIFELEKLRDQLSEK